MTSPAPTAAYSQDGEELTTVTPAQDGAQDPAEETGRQAEGTAHRETTAVDGRLPADLLHALAEELGDLSAQEAEGSESAES